MGGGSEGNNCRERVNSEGGGGTRTVILDYCERWGKREVGNYVG